MKTRTTIMYNVPLTETILLNDNGYELTKILNIYYIKHNGITIKTYKQYKSAINKYYDLKLSK